ncbi:MULTISPECIES: metal ABC transporter permease [Pseudomonas]|uniref:Metal ABC transporter permease n=1 Tax=Pseudomonas benzopyrenica TaxID=2993566 RepID=A0ABZ2FPB6_9PSED|nr:MULTISPECIES: metal ABC transporter permease [Pseudomonas]UUW70889.1 metal ABC transporter permease [Pseudomonas psychrotolerans]SEP04968.1 manganese/iron transport system permease protein [Pseudomonas sp. Snoq117.2]
MDWLLLTLEVDFMRQALLMAVLVAVPTALLSCFLVLKGWALLGDAIAHAVFPGLVLASALGAPLVVGAFVAGLGCALATGYLKRHSRVKQDTLMGVVFSGMFGLGLVLHARLPTELHLDHILLGDLLGVTPEAFWQMAVIAALVLLALVCRWRDLLVLAFDAAQARALGLRVELLHYGLLGLIALTVVGALQAVGMVPVVALLIAPGATAFLLTRSFGWMLLVATTLAVAAALGGVLLSLVWDSAPAPTMVLLLTVGFLLALAWRLWRDRRRSGDKGVQAA